MAIGWGRTGERKLTSEFPMSVEVKVTNESFCLDSLIGDRITDGMLCAYYEGRDSCQVKQKPLIDIVNSRVTYYSSDHVHCSISHCQR